MKTKILLTTLALPLAFAACTNDDFESAAVKPSVNGELVNVGQGFVISANKGLDKVGTKGEWIQEDKQLNFVWWPEIVENGGSYEAFADQIGLCWVGQSVGTSVYTNYRFEHAGWLNKDEKTVDVNPCEPYDVKNGYELGSPLSGSASGLSDSKSLTNATISGTLQEDGQYLQNIGGTERNLNSAFFRTPTETMFGGNYIAYAPFNEEMKDAGAIMAKSDDVFDVELTSGSEFAHLGQAMFLYAYAPGLVGGQQTGNFSMKHLSGLIRVRLTGDLTNVTSVSLVDANGKFIKEVGLDAAKIVAEGNNASTGKALYVGEPEYTNMLTANVSGYTSGNMDIWFAALPTTTGNLKVVVYDGGTLGTKKSAVYDVAPITVNPGVPTVVETIEVENADFKENVVTTEAALRNFTGATLAGGGTNSNILTEKGAIVTLLGDVTISEDWTMNAPVTIQGGKITIPATVTWSIGESSTINSDIEIENKGCCETKNGELRIGSNRSDKEVTLGGTIDNYGDIVLDAGGSTTTSTKNITTLTGTLNNHEKVVPETGKTQYASIEVSSLTTMVVEGAVVNDGNVTINGTGKPNEDGTLDVATTGSISNNYYITNGGNVNNAGNSFTNNKDGWFIDRIGSQLTQNRLTNEGEYVCEVNGQARLELALNPERRPTTRVRFINLDGQASLAASGAYTKAAFDLTDVNTTIDFEIAKNVYESGEAIRFESESDVTIGDLIVTSGKFIAHDFSKTATSGVTHFTFNVNSITVDGENAYQVDLQGNTNVTGDVAIRQMAANQWVNIGGVEGTNKVLNPTEVKVGGKFTVGDGATNYEGSVAFLNNNVTDVKADFYLYENGNCNIMVASTSTSDNYAAEVYANSIVVNEGDWSNNSRVITDGSHPLFSAAE